MSSHVFNWKNVDICKDTLLFCTNWTSVCVSFAAGVGGALLGKVQKDADLFLSVVYVRFFKR